MPRSLGTFTFTDVVKELEKPGRDPREGFSSFSYRDDVHELKDLKPGLLCPGIVTNVTNFGAFVDIGVHQDGLVHISQLSDSFVSDPQSVVSPGDRVQARVLEVNLEKSQIALTLKKEISVEERSARSKPARPVPTPSSGKNRSGIKVTPKRKPEVMTNNPFSVLASMKKNLKS